MELMAGMAAVEAAPATAVETGDSYVSITVSGFSDSYYLMGVGVW